ncbi:hypothetical protein [Streptomyces sp. MBT33]|uniref:hypothetical protein n=1 Tax=Streptomyces sp. MBT33 TaxID=1488363 RepID=UPI00190CAC75|nr:hypothetical protein [Streptomyces sp. MBT33]MBK3646333.1 hypothetical protein [Streptomyces sp. MBT33]
MKRTIREPLPGGGLVLAVSDRPGPPPLRFEADGERRLLRQGGRPLMLGRLEGDGCCHVLRVRRLDGHRSPLPPVRAQTMRAPGDWPHRYARWLEDADESPLHDGRWLLGERSRFQPGVWTEDFVTGWPDGRLDLFCGGGWHGVLPLRRLSSPDASRVKAYRKHAREGTLAPVLLWWVSFLDGWLLLDGHDRAVAALEEGGVPPCVVLTRVQDDEQWRRGAAEMTEWYRRETAEPAVHPASPGAERMRAARDEGYASALASLPYEEAPTEVWPLAGTPADRDDPPVDGVSISG